MEPGHIHVVPSSTHTHRCAPVVAYLWDTSSAEPPMLHVHPTCRGHWQPVPRLVTDDESTTTPSGPAYVGGHSYTVAPFLSAWSLGYEAVIPSIPSSWLPLVDWLGFQPWGWALFGVVRGHIHRCVQCEYSVHSLQVHWYHFYIHAAVIVTACPYHYSSYITYILCLTPGALWTYLFAADRTLFSSLKWIHPVSHCQDAYGDILNHQFTSWFLLSSSLWLCSLIFLLTLFGTIRQSSISSTLTVFSIVVTLRCVRLESMRERSKWWYIRVEWE